MSRSLALDVGNRRIGVAVSDLSKLIARPLVVVDRKVEDALTRLQTLIHEQQADEVIVGLPLNTDGKKGEQAARVEHFVAQLAARVPVPIHYIDERYSTADAQHIMAQQSAAARKRKLNQSDDAIAAAVILQRYLDERHPINHNLDPNPDWDEASSDEP